ncbi:MAG: SusE domain-containing protein [Vicingaceae bacterium]|nr:SusE domain-containing protein [Vicingaceae bacterium]
MKNFIYIAALSISLWSCGGGDEPTPAPVVNTAPTVPTLTYPTDKLLCIDNVLNFQWNASTDAEGGVISYEIQVAKDNLFTQIAHTQTSTTTSKSITLEKGVAYYWRIKATDNKSVASNYSATFSFYTEGVGITNHLPFSPELVAPELNSLVQTPTANLQWTASDVDTSDTLTYDVYFGTVKDNLPIVSPNQSAKTYSAAITASKTYYWKVVVKDGNGGQTIGQVWSFTTD